MGVLLSIGDFSRMTHLSVKALRHYHDLGLLIPADVDRFTGYRSYDSDQVPVAQVIRRLRDLGMPLDAVNAVLAAPDVDTRNSEIMAHLIRMEDQLVQTQATVASLRALLEEPPRRLPIEYRLIPAATTVAVQDVVTVAEFEEWWMAAFSELRATLGSRALTAGGPGGALYPSTFFELETAEVTAFMPVRETPRLAGRVQAIEVPALEAAVARHDGSLHEVDRTYGALGTVVAEQAIGVEGPIREYYLVGYFDTPDESRHLTDVCWPVWRTVGSA